MLGPKKDVSFKKKEHLKSRKIIASLFTEGKSKVIFPYRIIWRTCELPHSLPVQFAFSVSTRNFPLAVKRNQIKRQMREVYRVNKSPLQDIIQRSDKQLAVMIVFISKKEVPFELMRSKMIHSIRYLSKIHESS